MLTESFIAATENVKPPAAHLSSALKDVGVYFYQFQPQSVLQHGFKKSSVARNCLAVSNSHVYAAQAGKAIINVYNREKGNQEATVPFPQKITSLAYSSQAAVLIIGSKDGKLVLWEVGTGRISTSSASHIDAVTILTVTSDGEHVISASPDSLVHVWSLRSLLPTANAHSTYSNADSSSNKDPISTFNQHRASVQALAVGHAQNYSTNFVVSASEDKTCYVWALSTMFILRTILLLENPLCATIDPADRAFYIGSTDGSIQFVDMYEPRSESSILDTSTQAASIPAQLMKDAKWTPPSASKIGAAQCVACSYDGTALITGHTSGTLLRWDVAKHRVVNEITNLSSQSATNILMLLPNGFASKSQNSRFTIPIVVKPRLDLSNAVSDSGDSSIPADYTLHARVTSTADQSASFMAFLQSDGFPQPLLDDAIQSLVSRNTISSNSGAAISTEPDSHQVESLREEISRLRSQVTAHQNLDKQRLEWHTEKMKRREAVGLQKREAFFKAKKEGRNGDETMKPFEQMEREIDDEMDQNLHSQDLALSNVQDMHSMDTDK